MHRQYCEECERFETRPGLIEHAQDCSQYHPSQTARIPPGVNLIVTSGAEDAIKDDDRRYRVVEGQSFSEDEWKRFVARQKREAEVRENLGPKARIVKPYKPNRKQRRAQEKAAKVQSRNKRSKK